MFASVRAVLFDLDGTLVDSVPDLASAVNAMLADQGRPVVTEAQVRDWVGNGAKRLVKRALTGTLDGEPEPALFAASLDSFYAHYAEGVADRSTVYPGVIEALDGLRAQGIVMGVVTNKPERFIQPLLAALRLDGYFSVALGGDSLPQRKPDPAPLLRAAEMLGHSPQATLMVGDSRNDVEAGRRAGMAVIAVPYGYNYGEHISQAGPDRVVDDLRCLLPLLQRAA